MNLYALPFYSDYRKQQHRSRCQQYDTALYCPNDRFLPFVVTRTATGQGLDCVLVNSAEDDRLIASVGPEQIAVEVYTDGENDYYVYYGGAVAGLNLTCGRYYLNVKDQYSEVFTVEPNPERLLKIEWTHSSDIATLPYSLGFLQRLYLDAGLGAPDYQYTEKGEKDGNDELVPLSRSLEKNWQFDSGLVPEFLLDVLESLSLHDDVRIGGHADATRIKVKVREATPDACAMLAEVEFSEPLTLASQCGTAVGWASVDTSGYTPKPWLCGRPGSTDPFWENTGAVRCATTEETFSSAEIRSDVAPNNCPANTTPVAVPYVLAAAFYVSTKDQADADEKAQAYYDSTKQDYANQFGGCRANTLLVGVEVAEQPNGGPFGATFTRNDTAGALVIEYDYSYSVDNQPDQTGHTSITIADGDASAYTLVGPFLATSASVTITSTVPNTYSF